MRIPLRFIRTSHAERYNNLTKGQKMEEVEKKFNKFINLLKVRTINAIANSEMGISALLQLDVYVT